MSLPSSRGDNDWKWVFRGLVVSAYWNCVLIKCLAISFKMESNTLKIYIPCFFC